MFFVIGDDRSCNMKGIGTVHFKMFDEMVRKLKEVRYVPQLKMNLVLVSILEALGHYISIKDGVLKMIRVSMVILKGIRHNKSILLER